MISIRGHRWTLIELSIFVLIHCWLCGNCVVFSEESPKVHIKNGTLEGTFMLSRKGREIVAFRGIPYAQPPIGELRFEPPKQFGSWTGVRSAKNDSNMCVQRNVFLHNEEIIGVEDCLYLNVYSPKLPSNDSNMTQTKYPVIIWLHGGGWISGSSHSRSFGPKYLLDHDIILVAVNYRLGPLGFLSTEDLVSPGNQGMKDQAQSIRWVHENIDAFGGDSNQVTIYGESAGGASSHYHMISPLSRGLFHRVISQSGTAFGPWALTRPGTASNNAKRLGNLVKCPTENSTVFIKCMKKKDPTEIIATDRAFQVFDYDPIIPFGVVIEPDHPGAFIKEEPGHSLKSGNVSHVPWMMGITSQEGAFKVSGMYGSKDKGYIKLLDEKFMEFGPISLLYNDTCPAELKDNVTTSIRKFYLGENKIDESTRMNLVDMYTDAWFLISADRSIKAHIAALESPIYYYYFAYKGNFSFSSLHGDTETDYGVSHCDDLQYIFPISDHIMNSLTEEDYKMVDVMTLLLVNFAKWGNPTPEESTEILVRWSPVTTSRHEYLYIAGAKNLSMAADLHPDRINFWSNLPYRENVEFNHRMFRGN